MKTAIIPSERSDSIHFVGSRPRFLWLHRILILCKCRTFKHTGLALWEQAREEWLAHNSNRNSDDTDSTARAVAVPVEVDEVIDVIFAPRWRGIATPDDETGPPKRFPQNVPLPQMVDILQDLWEAEGLDV
jgi:hypothetical protein